MAGQFVKKDTKNNNCDDPVTGVKHPSFDYIHRTTTGDDDYPDDACDIFLQVKGKFDAINVVNGGDVNVEGDVIANEVSAGGITLTSRKDFDIPHPTKDGWRLRHVCLEGPEAGVYYRGRLTNDTMINLPEYWDGLVDPATITVSLTQIGSSQDLIVDAIQWGKRIKVRSGTAANIDCYFLVHAERKDGERLIVEYEGTSIDDYPGDNSQYTHNK